jgi:hypothetical protein
MAPNGGSDHGKEAKVKRADFGRCGACPTFVTDITEALQDRATFEAMIILAQASHDPFQDVQIKKGLAYMIASPKRPRLKPIASRVRVSPIGNYSR